MDSSQKLLIKTI